MPKQSQPKQPKQPQPAAEQQRPTIDQRFATALAAYVSDFNNIPLMLKGILKELVLIRCILQDTTEE